MGKKIKKVNPIPGQRLKKILTKEKKTSKWLCEHIYLTPPTVSDIINGRANLTRENAEKVIELFPNYNISWLLGLVGDHLMYAKDAEYNAIPLKAFYETIREQHISEDMKLLESISKYAGYNAEYICERLVLIDKNGEVSEFSLDQLKELQDDIKAFLQYRLQKLIEKGR